MTEVQQQYPKSFIDLFTLPSGLNPTITTKLHGVDKNIQFNTHLTPADYGFLRLNLHLFSVYHNEKLTQVTKINAKNESLLLEGMNQEVHLTECHFFCQDNEFIEFVKQINAVQLDAPNSLETISRLGNFDSHFELDSAGNGILILPPSDCCSPIHFNDDLFYLNDENLGFATTSLAVAIKLSYEWYTSNQ